MLLSCALLGSSLPAGLAGVAAAQPAQAGGAMDPAAALRLLEAADFFKHDEGGRLRGYVVDRKTGQLSRFGAEITRLYAAALERDEAARERYKRETGKDLPLKELTAHELLLQHRDNLEKIAKSDASPQAHERSINLALQELRKDFGDVFKHNPAMLADGKVDVLSTYGSLYAIWDAAGKARRPMDSREIQVSEGPNGTLSAYGPDGQLLYTQDKNNKIIFRPEILAAQKQAESAVRNARELGLGECVGKINQTGRIDYSLLNYYRCSLEYQLKSMDEERTSHAVQGMALLLGENPSPDRMSNPASRAEEEKRLAKKPIVTGSWMPSWVASAASWIPPVYDRIPLQRAGESVYAKLEKRDEYIAKSREYYETYKGQVEALKGRDSITEAEVQALEKQQGMIRRYMTMANLESLDYKIDFLLESLSFTLDKDAHGFPIGVIPAPKNPQSKELYEAIDKEKNAPEIYEQIKKLCQRLVRTKQLSFEIRKKLEDASMTSDLQTTNVALNAAQQELASLSQGQGVLSGMISTKAKADEHGRTWSETWAGSSLRARALSMLYYGFWNETSITPMVTDAFARYVVNGGAKLIGKDWMGEYVRGRDTLLDSRPKLEKVSAQIGKGQLSDAALDVALMDLDAHATHLSRPIERGGERVSLSDRMEAVQRKVRLALKAATDTHMISGVVVDTLKWSLVLSATAPIFSSLFRGVANASVIAEGARDVHWARRAFWNFNYEVTENIANRFAALSPEIAFRNAFAQGAYAMGYRFVRSAGMLGYTSAVFGAIGAVMTGVTHYAQGKHSQFYVEGEHKALGYWRAIKLGSLGSAQWLTQSWHPLILFVNIPFTAYQGTAFFKPMEFIANRGVFTSAAGWIPGKWALTEKVLERAASIQNPVLRFVVNQGLMMDHLLKFNLFSSSMAYLGRNISYAWDTVRHPEMETDTRVRYAIHRGAQAHESPLWMLLPQGPYQKAQMQEQQLSTRVGELLLRELTPSKLKGKGISRELIDFLNLTPATENGSKRWKIPERLRPRLKQSWREWIQEGPRDSQLLDQGVVPGKDQQIAILRKILLELFEKAYGTSPTKNPFLLLDLLREPDNTRLPNGLYLRENVRQVIQEKMVEIFKKDPALVEKIYEVERSKVEHPEFGRIDALRVSLVARFVRQAMNEQGAKFSEKVVQRTNEYLKETDALSDAIFNHAVKLAENMFRVDGRLDEPAQKFVQEIRKMLEEFGLRQESGAADPGHYTDVLKEIKDKIEAAAKDGRVKGDVHEALKGVVEYFRLHENAYHADNKGSVAHRKVLEAMKTLEDIAQKYAAGSKARLNLESARTKIIERVEEHFRELGIQKVNGSWEDKPVSNGRFNDRWSNDKSPSVMRDVKNLLEGIEGVSKSEAKLLTGKVFLEMASAPWKLYNSQGQPLMGWRAGQFISNMNYSLELLTSYGPGKVPHIFNKEPTGGGKTNIIVRFVAPVQLAIAKRDGREFHVVTPKKILVEQMKQEIDAMLLTGRISVKTWGDLVGDQAQRKLGQGDSTGNIAVAIDEGDMPLLLPQTTVGEPAGTTPAESLGYRRLQTSSDRTLDLVGGRAGELLREITGLLERMGDHWGLLQDKLPEAKKDPAVETKSRRSQADTPESLQRKLQQAAGKLEAAQRETFDLNATSARSVEREVLKPSVKELSEKKKAKKKSPVTKWTGVSETFFEPPAVTRAAEVLQNRAGSEQRKGYKDIQKPMESLRKSLSEIEARRESRGDKSVTRDEIIELNSRVRAVESKFFEAEIRILVGEHAKVLDKLPSQGDYHVKSMRELGQEIVKNVDELGGDGLAQRKPHGLEWVGYVFGRDLLAKDIRAELNRQEKTLRLARMDSEPMVRGIATLANQAEALGRLSEARALRKAAGLSSPMQDRLVDSAKRLEARAEEKARASGGEEAAEWGPQRLLQEAAKTKEWQEALSLRSKAEAQRPQPLPDTVFPEKIDAARRTLESTAYHMDRAGHAEWSGKARTLISELNVRNELGRNAKEVRAALGAKDESRADRLRLLLEERKTLLEKAATQKSPVYSVIGELARAVQSDADRLGYLARDRRNLQDWELAELLYAEKVARPVQQKLETERVLSSLKALREQCAGQEALVQKVDAIIAKIEPTRTRIEAARELGSLARETADLSGPEAAPLREAFRFFFEKMERARLHEIKMEEADSQTLKQLEAEHARLKTEIEALAKEINARSLDLANGSLKRMLEASPEEPGRADLGRLLNDRRILGGREAPLTYQLLKQSYSATEARFNRVNRELAAERSKPEKDQNAQTVMELQERANLWADRLQEFAQDMAVFEGRLLPTLLQRQQMETMVAEAQHKAEYESARAKLKEMFEQAPAGEPRLKEALRRASAALEPDAVPWELWSNQLAQTPAQAGAQFNKKSRALVEEYTAKLEAAYEADLFLSVDLKQRKAFKLNGFKQAYRSIPIIGELYFRQNKMMESMIFKMRGKEAPGSPYVHDMVLSAYQYFHNNVSEFRFDGKDKAVETVFVGENMRDLQEHSKFVEEWKNGVDIMDRLESRVLLGPREMFLDERMPVYGTSGTDSPIARREMKGLWSFTGKGSKALRTPKFILAETRAELLQTILDRTRSADKEYQTELASRKKHKKDADDLRRPLTFASVPDRDAMRDWNRILRRAGVRPEQITEIFSDVSRLQQDYPEAIQSIQSKMNTQGLARNGETMLTLLDARVGTRGVDLPLRGGGYRDITMYFDKPYKMSTSQRDQYFGRAAPGRTVAGTKREAVFTLDVQSAKDEPLFRRMVLMDPIFRRLRAEFQRNAPEALREAMLAQGRQAPDWSDLHAYVKTMKAGDPMPILYKEAVLRWINKGMTGEEVRQLQGSGFLGQEGLAASGAGAMPWSPGRVGATRPERFPSQYRNPPAGIFSYLMRWAEGRK